MQTLGTRRERLTSTRKRPTGSRCGPVGVSLGAAQTQRPVSRPAPTDAPFSASPHRGVRSKAVAGGSAPSVPRWSAVAGGQSSAEDAQSRLHSACAPLAALLPPRQLLCQENPASQRRHHAQRMQNLSAAEPPAQAVRSLPCPPRRLAVKCRR